MMEVRTIDSPKMQIVPNISGDWRVTRASLEDSRNKRTIRIYAYSEQRWVSEKTARRNLADLLL